MSSIDAQERQVTESNARRGGIQFLGDINGPASPELKRLASGTDFDDRTNPRETRWRTNGEDLNGDPRKRERALPRFAIPTVVPRAGISRRCGKVVRS